MRVVVDFDLCESNAICMALVPDVFEVRADDYLYILDETPGEERRDDLLKAVNGCPVRAISIAE